MQERLRKVALVTGATSGIGAAVVSRLAKAEFDLVLTGRRVDRLEAAARSIKDYGARCALLSADIATSIGTLKLTERIKAQLDAWNAELSVLLHVAGSWHDDQRAFFGRDFVNTGVLEIDGVLGANLIGPAYLTKGLLDSMPRHRNAKIIAITGTFPSGGAGWLHYFTAKQALEIFMKGLASEVEKLGIQVNCVSPSYVATEPVKRFFPDEARTALTPDEVADIVEFLLSAAANNITGQVIAIKSPRE